MKFFIAILLLAPLSALAQCNPTLPAGTQSFPFGVTDSVTPTQFVPGPFRMCDNGTLYYFGNNPDTVYLESSARLRVGYCFNLVVFMKNNARLEIDTTVSSPGQRRIAHIYYDPAFTSFQDTAGTMIVGITACPSMTYTYASGMSSCSPNSIPDPAALGDWVLYPNPAMSTFNIELVEPQPGDFTVTLMDMQGRTLARRPMRGGSLQWDTDGMAKGSYLLALDGAKGRQVRMLHVQ